MYSLRLSFSTTFWIRKSRFTLYLLLIGQISGPSPNISTTTCTGSKLLNNTPRGSPRATPTRTPQGKCHGERLRFPQTVGFSLGLRVIGLRVIRFRGIGFRVMGFRIIGFSGLGCRGLFCSRGRARLSDPRAAAHGKLNLALYPSTLNPKPSTHPKPWTLNPELWTLNPEP